MKRLFGTVPALLLAACTVSVIGPEQPLTPDGEPATVTLTSGAKRTGELLGVTATELILKEDAGLVAVDLPALREVLVSRYERVARADWNELTPFCRYPQGLTDEHWRQLLRNARQDDFIRVRASRQ